MPVKQMCRLLSSCVMGSLILAACSSPDPQESANDAATEAAANAAAPTEAAMNAAVAPESAAPEVVTNSSQPEAPKDPAKAPVQPAEAKAPPPAPKAVQPPQFATCLACHSIEQGAAGKIGPNLFGVVGSKAGSKPDFAYSDAMKESGITWTPAELNTFLLAPQTKVPGTKMTMKGPSDERIRQTMIDYLATLK